MTKNDFLFWSNDKIEYKDFACYLSIYDSEIVVAVVGISEKFPKNISKYQTFLKVLLLCEEINLASFGMVAIYEAV